PCGRPRPTGDGERNRLAADGRREEADRHANQRGELAGLPGPRLERAGPVHPAVGDGRSELPSRSHSAVARIAPRRQAARLSGDPRNTGSVTADSQTEWVIG